MDHRQSTHSEKLSAQIQDINKHCERAIKNVCIDKEDNNAKDLMARYMSLESYYYPDQECVSHNKV